MVFLSKLAISIGSTSRAVSRPIQGNNHSRTPGAPPIATGTTRVLEMHETTRISNGLKEFLWNLDGLGRGTLLDLGPAWQTTLSFFIESAFPVSSQAILPPCQRFPPQQALQ